MNIGGAAQEYPSFKLGEHTFYFRPFTPFEALFVFGELQSGVFGPLVASLEKAEKFDDEDAVTKALAAGVGDVLKSLNGAELLKTARLLLPPSHVSVKVNGAEPSVKFTEDMSITVMSGLMDIFEVSYKSLEVNFSDFLVRVFALFIRVRGVVEKKGGLLAAFAQT